MVYVTSDLHGFPIDKFFKLLEKASFNDDDFLFILGDVIDRGDDGVKILQWLLTKPNVQLILGNHEAMMLSCSFLFEEVTDENVNSLSEDKLALLYAWQTNGAKPTIKGLLTLSNDERLDILDYLRDCPLYDSVATNGRHFLLVHGGLGNFRPDKKISEYLEDELLWTRPEFDEDYSTEYTTILGHTPTRYYSSCYRGKILKTKTWIDIDTGASNGLAPMLLRLDDMEEFYLEEGEY